MPSELFTHATTRERRSTVRSFQSSPVMRLARDVRKATRGRRGREAMKDLRSRLMGPEVKRLVGELERGFKSRYAERDDGTLNRVLDLLGPVGTVIRSAVGEGRNVFGRDSWDAAVNLIRAFGGEVITKRGRPEYDRGIEAAKEALEAAGYEVNPPGDHRTEIRDIDHVAAERGATGPFGTAPDYLAETQQQVHSDSVYSYSYIQQTERYGTLYVTFRGWTPNAGKTDGPGATYAYYDVTPDKYRHFARAAQRSAGEAVWDYLRVRGSAFEHQHPYELVGGVPVPKSPPYIPRKASTRGYMERTLRVESEGRTRLMRSQLPSREYEQGRPNRGEPNRGQPNRGW